MLPRSQPEAPYVKLLSNIGFGGGRGGGEGYLLRIPLEMKGTREESKI